jgi:phage terminase Nu1 subunit (DNA packaging protein)
LALILSRDQLAEALGVPPLLIGVWESQGMPVASQSGLAPLKGKTWWRVSRRELAELFSRHPDTLTHSSWLRPAILQRGGRGREQTFDLRLAIREQTFDLRLAIRLQWARAGLMESVEREAEAVRRGLFELAAATRERDGAGRRGKSQPDSGGRKRARGNKPKVDPPKGKVTNQC